MEGIVPYMEIPLAIIMVSAIFLLIFMPAIKLWSEERKKKSKNKGRDYEN